MCGQDSRRSEHDAIRRWWHLQKSTKALCKFRHEMTRYFWRSMASQWRRGRSRQPWIVSPKTHRNALWWERRFQERVLGDQWDTQTQHPARCPRFSEKRRYCDTPPYLRICLRKARCFRYIPMKEKCRSPHQY